MASVFVFCFGVFLVLPCICDRIQHQLLLAISPLFLPSVSPLPSLSLLTPLCPFWLDSTQALYATCPSVRLYLREPQSLSLELPLLRFMRCPPFLSSLHLSNSSLFSSAPCCSLQIQTHTYTTVIASVSYFIHLNACTKEHYREWLSLTVTCGLDARYMGCVRHKLPNNPSNVMESLFQVGQLFISANIPKL